MIRDEKISKTRVVLLVSKSWKKIAIFNGFLLLEIGFKKYCGLRHIEQGLFFNFLAICDDISKMSVLKVLLNHQIM